MNAVQQQRSFSNFNLSCGHVCVIKRIALSVVILACLGYSSGMGCNDNGFRQIDICQELTNSAMNNQKIQLYIPGESQPSEVNRIRCRCRVHSDTPFRVTYKSRCVGMLVTELEERGEVTRCHIVERCTYGTGIGDNDGDGEGDRHDSASCNLTTTFTSQTGQGEEMNDVRVDISHTSLDFDSGSREETCIADKVDKKDVIEFIYAVKSTQPNERIPLVNVEIEDVNAKLNVSCDHAVTVHTRHHDMSTTSFYHSEPVTTEHISAHNEDSTAAISKSTPGLSSLTSLAASTGQASPAEPTPTLNSIRSEHTVAKQQFGIGTLSGAVIGALLAGICLTIFVFLFFLWFRRHRNSKAVVSNVAVYQEKPTGSPAEQKQPDDAGTTHATNPVYMSDEATDTTPVIAVTDDVKGNGDAKAGDDVNKRKSRKQAHSTCNPYAQAGSPYEYIDIPLADAPVGSLQSTGRQSTPGSAEETNGIGKIPQTSYETPNVEKQGSIHSYTRLTSQNPTDGAGNNPIGDKNNSANGVYFDMVNNDLYDGRTSQPKDVTDSSAQEAENGAKKMSIVYFEDNVAYSQGSE